jgi:hypothetical protein
VLPPKAALERSMSGDRISEWIVPPVIVPLFLLLLVCGAVVLNG